MITWTTAAWTIGSMAMRFAWGTRCQGRNPCSVHRWTGLRGSEWLSMLRRGYATCTMSTG
uniref:Uncharacterized protein n=1 Tax=Arundo donax TaxID=35708 RepID=A0A0A9C133_ARUDO